MSTSIMNAVKRALEGRGFKRGFRGGGNNNPTNAMDDSPESPSPSQPKTKKTRPIEILEILDSSDDDNDNDDNDNDNVVPHNSIRRQTKRRRRQNNNSDDESSGPNNDSEDEDEEEHLSEEDEEHTSSHQDEQEEEEETATSTTTRRRNNNNHNISTPNRRNKWRRVTPRYIPTREHPALTRRQQQMKTQNNEEEIEEEQEVVPVVFHNPTQALFNQDTSETETEPEEDDEEPLSNSHSKKTKKKKKKEDPKVVVDEQVVEEVVVVADLEDIKVGTHKNHHQKNDNNHHIKEPQKPNDNGNDNDNNKAQSSSPSSSSKIVLPPRDENGHLSNIAHVKPWVGMKLEIRDTDHIWSAARLVEITKEKASAGSSSSSNKKQEEYLLYVTVHCEGWDSAKWDERVPWPSSRLARLYTYTKRVKCLVSLLPKVRSRKGSKPAKGRKIPTNLWPCTVQIRMPHPVQYNHHNPHHEGGGGGVESSSSSGGEGGGAGVCDDEEQCLLAEELLKLEEKVFVQPYGISYLPQWIVDSLDVDKGRWFNINKVKLWRTDPESEIGALPKDFMPAFQEAMDDTEITGFLPARIFGTGSLVDDFFRVRTREGENLGGALREGTIPRPPPQRHNNHNHADSSSPRPDAVMSCGGDMEQQLLHDESLLLESGGMDGTNTQEDSREAMLRQLRLKYTPPPSLPPSVRLPEPIYPGVTQCKTSNGWVASVSISGNDAFLGTYPSQTEAWTATKLTAQKKGNHDEPITTKLMTTRDAKIADMKAIPIETIIEATEREFNRVQHNYSLHEWTIQKIKHTAYEKQIQKYEQPLQHEDPKDKEGNNVNNNNNKKNDESGIEGNTNDSNQTEKKKSRKQRQPRKVDLKTHSYNQS